MAADQRARFLRYGAAAGAIGLGAAAAITYFDQPGHAETFEFGGLDVPRFPERIKEANRYVENHYQGMVEAYHNLKVLSNSLEKGFRRQAAPLVDDCEGIYNDLKHLQTRQPYCVEAQNFMLPQLFKKKVSTKSAKPIDGCAVPSLKRKITASPCKCATGSMAVGCKDAEVDSDHMLICQHLRENVLPDLELHKLFAPGQVCSVDARAKFNQSLLPPNEPTDFKLPGTPELELCPWPLALLQLFARDIGGELAVVGCRQATARQFL